MIGLTPKQEELLRFLEANEDASVDEMRQAMGYASKCQIVYLLNGLEERGRIRRLRYRARSVEVLRPLTPVAPPRAKLRVVYGPGHFEDLARLNRARYALEGAER